MTAALWRSAFVAALLAVHPLHVESVAWIAERKDVLSTLLWLLTLAAWLWHLEARAAARDRRIPSENTRPTARYLLVLVLYACGLMAKPMLVTLPFTLLLLDVWPLRRLTRLPSRTDPTTTPRQTPRPAEQAQPGRVIMPSRTDQSITPRPALHPADQAQPRRAMMPSPRHRAQPPMEPPDRPRGRAPSLRASSGTLARLVIEKAPFFAMAAASSVVTFVAQRRGGAVQTLEDLVLPQRLANAALAYVSYLGRRFWPSGLAIFYPHGRLDLLAAPVAGAVLLLAGITWAALRLWKIAPYVAFGWFWYLGTLVPVIGLVQVGSQAMADRYTYVPLVGVFVAIAWGVPDLLDRASHGRRAAGLSSESIGLTAKRGVAPTQGPAAPAASAPQAPTRRTGERASLAAVSCVLVPVLALVTRAQVGYWASDEALYGHALAVTTDNWLAHAHLGRALFDRGRTDEAIEHQREALRISPGFAGAHDDLGIALASRGRIDEAIERYMQALRLAPESPLIHNNLGTALVRQGRFDEAIEQYAQALRLEPGFAEAHNDLGVSLVRRGRIAEGIDRYHEALRLRPEYAEAHDNLGLALNKVGRRAEALEEFRSAVRLRPDSASAHLNVGNSLAAADQIEPAIEEYEAALRLRPDDVEALNDLALVLSRTNRSAEAIERFETALRINPESAELHNNLGVVLFQMGRLADALAQFEEAVRLKPDFGDARENLHRVQEQLRAQR